MADFNKPVLTDQYADVLQEIKALYLDSAKMFDGVNLLNTPPNIIRWGSANSRLERFDGFTWNPLVSRMSQDVTMLGGKILGNSSNNIPINDGNVNTNLVAQFATNIKNEGNVSLATGANANGISVKTTSIVTGGPVKHLVFEWVQNNWSISNISGGPTTSNGLGFYFNNSEKARITETEIRIGSNIVWHAGNLASGGLANVGAAGAFGGISINGNTGGWYGFRFGGAGSVAVEGGGTGSRYLMSANGSCGEYEYVDRAAGNSSASSRWMWQWVNGTLTSGSIPWSRITNIPTFSYLPTTGGTVTGVTDFNADYLYVGNTNSGGRIIMRDGDPTGAKSIRSASGVIGFTDATNSRWLSYTNNAGQIAAEAYGWLHDYFIKNDGSGRAYVKSPTNNGSGYAMITNTTRIGNWGVGNGYLTVDVDNAQYSVSLSGGGGGLSDARYKNIIGPTKQDSLHKVSMIEFIDFTYNEKIKVLNGELWLCGVTAQNLETIDPAWSLAHADGVKTPNTTKLLYEALHAIQQLSEEVKDLRTKVLKGESHV